VNRIACLLVGAGAIFFVSSLGAADGWRHLRKGMTRDETSAKLGDPLFKNHARGFELWLYDCGAEVVCYRGALIAWTAPPASSQSVSEPVPEPPKPVPAPASTAATPEKLREQLYRVYDKFPLFRTEIRL
jgi:hypothetical protein